MAVRTRHIKDLLVQLAPDDQHEMTDLFFQMKLHICELPFKILRDKKLGFGENKQKKQRITTFLPFLI